MKTKLWQKENKTDALIERFTVGNDREIDLKLAKHDVFASKAHAKMLQKCALINEKELHDLLEGLEEINSLLTLGEFSIDENVEDIHSQIEFFLTKKYGETGKKIHTARSRNDQILTAIKLYLKEELSEIRSGCESLIKEFYAMGKKYSGIVMPGYTHFQVAMPSSFEMWFNAYAESLEDDIELINAAYTICDKNPLGSAAGYGTNFNIDRAFTTGEMNFSKMNVSAVYAQMTRGKSEKVTAMAISSVASTLSKFSYDVCLYMCQNFDFVTLPEDLTTGSSIMPHKKNPDVFELVRAKCNLIQGSANQLTLLCNNLPSGYHRDMQLTKNIIMDAIDSTKDCIEVLLHTLPQLIINEKCADKEIYKHMYSVKKVNELVMQGVPFRDAYAKVAGEIENQQKKTLN